MTKKERLVRSLRGLPVDRPPVSFYELNGYSQNEHDTNPYNVFSDPSWKGLLALAKERSDKLVLYSPKLVTQNGINAERHSFVNERGSIYVTYQIKTPGRVLTKRTRRDMDIDTVWTYEHYLKDIEDVKAYLSLPEEEILGLDVSGFLECEKEIGDSGLVGIDTGDALCAAADLFSMADYLVFASTERELFTELLEREQKKALRRVQLISEALPGRLYRICGPEYASPPYLPPELFRRYVTRYDTEIIRLIHQSGGYARVHSHGNLSRILDDIAGMGADALDPIEPPPQGDVSLRYVRERYGDRLTLFGNIEVSEIETMETSLFKDRVKQALEEGMSGQGRGFVLMPTACPLSRKLSERTFYHYQIMMELVENTYY